MHGKTSPIHNDGKPSFRGWETPSRPDVTTPHRGTGNVARLPGNQCRDGGGEIMGVRHREYPSRASNSTGIDSDPRGKGSSRIS
jgi:anthranilate/para-aminobenzoate synthase component II